MKRRKEGFDGERATGTGNVRERGVKLKEGGKEN